MMVFGGGGGRPEIGGEIRVQLYYHFIHGATSGPTRKELRFLDVGACLKVNTRALGRGALHRKVDSIPLLLTSERYTGRACWQLFTRSVSTIQYPNNYIPNPFST